MIVDSHVHFWDPAALPYPWLAGIPVLDRAYLPADYRAATHRVYRTARYPSNVAVDVLRP